MTAVFPSTENYTYISAMNRSKVTHNSEEVVEHVHLAQFWHCTF